MVISFRLIYAEAVDSQKLMDVCLRATVLINFNRYVPKGISLSAECTKSNGKVISILYVNSRSPGCFFLDTPAPRGQIISVTRHKRGPRTDVDRLGVGAREQGVRARRLAQERAKGVAGVEVDHDAMSQCI